MAANTPSLPLLEFPVDIIHYIADLLTDGELFFLGITCRALYATLCPRMKPLADMVPKSQSALVLSWFERRNRTHFACFVCGRLHRSRFRIIGGLLGLVARHGLDFDSDCYALSSLYLPIVVGIKSVSRFTRIPFFKAQLVMDRHFSGVGNPLLTLDFAGYGTWRQSNGYFVIASFTCTPRIQSNNLLISLRYKISFFGNLQDTSEALFADRRFAICRHLNPESLSAQNPAPEHLLSLNSCHKQLGHCRFCPTDYELTVKSVANRRTKVEITTYTQLGSCRSLQDWNWKLCTFSPGRLIEDQALLRRRLAIFPGSIRLQWLGEMKPDRRTSGFGSFLKRAIYLADDFVVDRRI
jgi:hypothetical protein